MARLDFLWHLIDAFPNSPVIKKPRHHRKKPPPNHWVKKRILTERAKRSEDWWKCRLPDRSRQRLRFNWDKQIWE